jgi:hypothetical protein
MDDLGKGDGGVRGDARLAVEIVPCGRQLETGAHFCSGRVVSSDLASRGRVGGRAIGELQVRGNVRDESRSRSRALLRHWQVVVVVAIWRLPRAWTA